MNRFSLKKNARSILAAYGCLLFLLGIGPDLILCFSHDGRVTLEIASSQKGCTTAPASGSPGGVPIAASPPPPVENPSCCGSCLDIPLAASTPAAFGRPESGRPTPEGPSPARLGDERRGNALRDTLPCVSLAALSGPPKSVTDSLRSIVLRI